MVSAFLEGLIPTGRRLKLLMGYHPLALMPPPKSTPRKTGTGSSTRTGFRDEQLH
jgi:hypothetical protein